MDKTLKMKILSEWKSIDQLLGVNPEQMSEDLRNKYFATKSLLIKECEFFKRGLGVPDYTREILTENVDVNTKDLVESVDEKLVEVCKKKKKVAEELSRVSVENDLDTKLAYKLETLLLGDVFDYLLENKIQKLEDLGLNISKQLIDGYIKTIIEITKHI